MRRCSALLLLLLSTVASADPGQDAYVEGKRLYDLHEWAAAIAKFKESYALRQDPASLFDIAQAYRLAGDCANAVSFYKTYRRNFPAAKNLDKVEKFLATLEPCPAAAEPMPVTTVIEPPKVEPKPDVPVRILPPVEPPHPEPSHRGRALRAAGITIGAVGVASLATSGVFLYLGSRANHDAESGSGMWDPSIQRRGKRDNAIAAVTLGVGAAGVAAGILLYTLAPHGELSHVAVAPHADGAIASWTFPF